MGRFLECPSCHQQINTMTEGVGFMERCGWCYAILHVGDNGNVAIHDAAPEGRLAWLQRLAEKGMLSLPLPSEPDSTYEDRIAYAKAEGHPYYDEAGNLHAPAVPGQPPPAPGPQELIQQRREISVQSRVPGPAMDVELRQQADAAQLAKPKGSLWQTGKGEAQEEDAKVSPFGAASGREEALLVHSPGTEQPVRMRVYELARLLAANVDTLIGILQQHNILPQGEPERLRLNGLSAQQVAAAKEAIRAQGMAETFGRTQGE